MTKLVAPCALIAGAALVAAGCGTGQRDSRPPARSVTHSGSAITMDRSSGSESSPFAPGGYFAAGGESGLWGDTGSGPDGNHLGCIPGRRYAQAISLRNATKHAVIVTGASGVSNGSAAAAGPTEIRLIAIQLSLAPPQPAASDHLDQAVFGIFRSWSDSPARPVTIPAGRSVVVQRDYRMGRCTSLAGGRTVVVPGTLRLAYRTGGKTGTQTVPAQGSGIVLAEGPVKKSCASVSRGSSSIVSTIACRAARRAAVECHPMSHGSWGMCTSGGTLWECGRMGERAGWALTETCYLPHTKSHWFRLSWKHAA